MSSKTLWLLLCIVQNNTAAILILIYLLTAIGLPPGGSVTVHIYTQTILRTLFSSYQLHAHFLYSITIYMLHHNPQHVSSSSLLIFRRTNCIITASGIVTLCKRPYSMPFESGLQSALNRHTVRPFTESNHTRCCNNTICPPEDKQSTARNMLGIIM